MLIIRNMVLGIITSRLTLRGPNLHPDPVAPTEFRGASFIIVSRMRLTGTFGPKSEIFIIS